MTVKSKIRMGMIGGGHGSFIGKVHRHAAALDSEIELVCGAFSSSAEKSIASGKSLYLDEKRCYSDFTQMLKNEAELPVSERMHFVSIVTPNHLHFSAAKAALEAGFHVMSDKPATMSLEQALELRDIVEKSGKLYGLTHTYLGYPMVKHAKELIENGELGKVRKVIVEYHQGWLATSEDENCKQASWRLDPKQAGISCCMGDIGVHAANLMEYITGLQIEKLSADLGAVVNGRVLDDDGNVLMRLTNGVRASLSASQIAVGEENNLAIRVYGDKASLHWQQQEPNTLEIKRHNLSSTVARIGVGSFSEQVTNATRIPAGHPEGYIEAFANLYRSFAAQIRNFESTQQPSNEFSVPGILEAVRGMAFIENVVASNLSDAKWHQFVTEHSPLPQ